MADQDTKKAVTIVLGVCLVCSLLVSFTAVTLKSIQETNKREERFKNILQVSGLYQDNNSVSSLYKKNIEPEIINLSQGEVMKKGEYPEGLDPQNFDIQYIAKHSQYSYPLPDSIDIADIKRKPAYMIVYKVIQNSIIEQYIFPIYGKGLWSTMWGFISLEKDLHTIRGLTFYEQGETPGLGGEVDNPDWKKIWVGKKAFDTRGKLRIQVIKGEVDPSSPEAKYQVDGLSGSTLTTRGVNNLVRFWLGKHGYGPFLERLKVQR